MQNLLDNLERALHRVENLLFVNYSEINEADFEVNDGDKKMNHASYGLKK